MSVLLIVTEVEETTGLTRWSLHFALALDCSLFVLCAADPNAQQKDVYTPLQECTENDNPLWNNVLLAARPTASGLTNSLDSGPEVLLKSCASDAMQQTALCEIRSSQAILVVVGKHETQRGRDRTEHLARYLYAKSPCTTLLMRLGESEGEQVDRILIPAAGGPHSMKALELGRAFAHNLGTSVTPLFVEPDADEVAKDVGERLLRKIVQRANMDQEDHVFPKVQVADNIHTGIADAAVDGAYHLVLIGASNVGQIRQYLFGTLPQRLLTGERSTAIAVVRAAQPLMTRFTASFERLLDLAVPQLERSDRVSLFESLQQSARWNFDFLALIALSTAIASLGLLQNSTAVVIGAMLVAPLMAPLLAAGLALVQGNLPLMQSSAKAILFGFVTALAISFTAGFCVPISNLTRELLSRGGPTLLDLGVALLSGMAAAYCTARPNLSAALPGVAIAAALVPPIATTGISLAMDEHLNAKGAALLFGTNVVAVILGASFAFYAAGIRPHVRQSGTRQWPKHLLAVLLLAAAILTLPLGSVLWTQLRTQHAHGWTLQPELETAVVDYFKPFGYDVTELEAEQGPYKNILHVKILGPDELSESIINGLKDILRNYTLTPMELYLYPTKRINDHVEKVESMSENQFP